jgi:hypothetical protein
MGFAGHFGGICRSLSVGFAGHLGWDYAVTFRGIKHDTSLIFYYQKLKNLSESGEGIDPKM